MAVKLQRPILVGGIGLSLLLWLLDSVQNSVAEFGGTAMLGIMAASLGVWLLKRPKSLAPQKQTIIPSPTKEVAQEAIATLTTTIDKLALEVEGINKSEKISNDISQLRQKVVTLTQELERQELSIVITGNQGVGKTALTEILKSQWMSANSQKIEITDITWLPEWITKNEHAQVNLLSPYDLILFVTTGDLIDSEFQALSKLTTFGQRFILVWNKQDLYLLDQKPQIIQKIKDTLSTINSEENLVGISARPNSIKVRKYQQDGSIQESIEQPLPEISGLTEKLNQLLEKEREKLVWATTRRKAEIVRLEAKNILNQIRRERAVPVIEQYQWIAAATAFANPVPALDLLATAAINAQLIVDLSAIYEQKISLEQGKQVAGTMAELMLKLGLVELSTKTLTTILKSNSITFVAGGGIQAVSAAYLTRVAGMSLVEYFATQTDSNSVNVEKLGKIIQSVFSKTQENNFLKSFVTQVISHILPQEKKLEAVSTVAE
ncbi:slr1306 family protein [Dapis sp. BLCC M229]|uniref:slr1306 family protein n=1 Tax=Dapis sp. BLCC M229 TaxID=3400188 RepID=UPI003CE6C2F2